MKKVARNELPQALIETERMDSDGTDRARVAYEYLFDLMRNDDEMRGVSLLALSRHLRKFMSASLR